MSASKAMALELLELRRPKRSRKGRTDKAQAPPTNHNQLTPTMPTSAKPETNEVQTAQAVDPAAICSAWWMYDNHTFQPVHVTSPNWRGYVMTCYDIDGYGSFFVRESPNGKTIFDLHGRGKEGRATFAAALDAWTPPNAKVEGPAGNATPQHPKGN